MPSIASHYAVASKVSEILNIESDEFLLGNILPDIIDKKDSHMKIQGSFYLIPDINKFVNKCRYPKDVFLGYLTHLLLDKYFLEDYIYKKFNEKELFLSKLIYNDYTSINYLLVKDFNINVNKITNIISNTKYNVNKEKLEYNINCINSKYIGKPKYIDYLEYVRFLNKVSKDIASYINIDACLFVMENVANENKRKNDIKKLKIVLDNDFNLISVPFNNKEDIKESIKNKIKSIIGSDTFHLEQVYTLGDKKYNSNGVNIIYLGVTNIENIKKLEDNYKLVDFDIIDKDKLVIGDKVIKYVSKFKKNNNSLEYYHELKVDDINLEKMVIEILTSYKQIVSKIDYTDIMFKFLPKYFALEDVRIVYEMIKNTTVDKSNFRKKIMKYCKSTDKTISNKGYRPTLLYEFVLDENDIWV